MRFSGAVTSSPFMGMRGGVLANEVYFFCEAQDRDDVLYRAVVPSIYDRRVGMDA